MHLGCMRCARAARDAGVAPCITSALPLPLCCPCPQSGEKVAFDYALLATGSTYPSGVKPAATALLGRTQRLQQFADIRQQVGRGGTKGCSWSGAAADSRPG